MKQRTRQCGLTLIELMVSITILMIAVGGILIGINFGAKVTRHNVNKTLAMSIIVEKLENVKTLNYANIASSSGVENAYNLRDASNPAFNWSITVSTGNTKTVTVTVTWVKFGFPFVESESAMTIISP